MSISLSFHGGAAALAALIANELSTRTVTPRLGDGFDLLQITGDG